ncbi:TraV family lipoprotein [Neisseria meningitidis]|uniref:TraV family lipoprotein n=1 Tax=Neisseria meningitidis TaxID=487 RepID=UPI001C5647B5|nr:TraV family lipoprotein [Neisseria meningitidis]MBW3957271.1 TraV family lipoprotein [Neisseria meningitidis]
MMRLKALSITAAILILSGCSTLTMSGIGGSEKFRCSNAWNSDDPYCESISSNYKASVAGVLKDGMKRQVGQPYTDQSARTLMLTQAYSSGTPVRSQSEIARIWVAPYLDTDGDLNDQSFTYVVLNQGDWLIAHNQQQIIDEYRPIRLLGNGAKTSDSTVDPSSTNSNNTNDRIPDVGVNLNLQETSGIPGTTR